jgi:hypothetical protein
MGYGTSPEKHPAGSGPYANSGGILSLRFPPVYGTMTVFGQVRNNIQKRTSISL